MMHSKDLIGHDSLRSLSNLAKPCGSDLLRPPAREPSLARELLWVGVLALIVPACGSSSPEPLSSNPSETVVTAGRGQTFELKPGQTARVGDGGLLVGFRGVAQDSRCPTDVSCVWAGDAQVRVPVTIGRMAWTPLDLHTNVEPRSATFRDYKITVVSLRPDPRSGQRIPAADYALTLRVE